MPIFEERMTGLYSYDVFDSPDFISAKKIERRIAKHDKKMRDDKEIEAEKYRKQALENLELEGN